MKTSNNKEIKYNKVVNIDKENNEITVLDKVFKHSDDLKGATGSKFEAVSKAQYKDALSKDNVIDYILSCGLVSNETPKHLQEKMAEVYYKDMKANGELERCIFDLSYQDTIWDELRKHGYPKSKYPIFTCIGGGRCFDKDFQGNVNPELSEIIREYEK